MRTIITCLLGSLLLACAEGDERTPSEGQAPSIPDPPPAVDTAVSDTVSPDTVMARDTAQAGIEY